MAPQLNATTNGTDAGLVSPAQDNIQSVYTALSLNAAIGAACMLGFIIFRSFMKQYQLRLYLPYVTIKPPPFAKTGFGKWFGWLKAVFTVSDAFVLRSAGLDALVLQKAHAVGVQMMLPMAIFGCCLLLPLQISQAYIAGDKSYGRVTMANIAPSSSIMWAHWCTCFLFLGWTFTLLEYHTRQYAAVRQHYLRGGDDPNYWRDLHMAEADGTHVHKGAKLLDVLGAAKFEGMLDAEEELFEAQVKQRHWYQRMLRALTSWTGQESVESAAQQAGNKSVKIDLAHDVIQGDFLRDAASGAAASGDEEAATAACSTVYMEADEEPLSATAAAAGAAAAGPAAANGTAGSTGSKDQASENDGATAASPSPRKVSGDDVVLHVPDSKTAPGGPSSSGDSAAAGGKAPHRVSTNEDLSAREVHGADVGSLVAFKWWTQVDQVATKDGKLRKLTEEEAADIDIGKVMLAKPSVRYRKTVNAYDRNGHRTAVNAQQYAVLVTNVNAPCYPEFMVKRSGIPGAGKCGNLAKDALPPAVQFGLQGQLQGHAEALPPAAESAQPSKDVEASAGMRRSGVELWAAVRRACESGALRRLGRSQSYSLVANIFSSLFPDDYDRVVPVFNFRRVDLLMRQWDVKQGQLEAALFKLRHTGQRPLANERGCMGGPKVDLIDRLSREVAALEPRILAEREAALKYSQTPSWFVLFRTQKAAAIASSCNILPMNQDLFQVHPAPGPEEVNWQSLWFNHQQRVLRGWLTTPFAVIVVLLPVSGLTSAISMLNSEFCKAVQWELYCSAKSSVSKIARGLITGFLPSLLITLWQGLALPRLVYLVAQSEGRHYSLSRVDMRMGEIYFFWNVFNMFAQGVLGSAAISTATGAAVYMQTASFLNNPQEFPNLLGQALPTSSKFFFTYIIMRTLMSVPLRFLITQPGVWQCWLRLLDLFGGPVPPRVSFMRDAIRSPRFGVEYGSSLLVALICLAFSIISPLIVLFGCAFFAATWVFWRYQLIYNYQRKYESGGLMWPFFANRILVCCAIMVAFTGCVMIVKKAFVQATLLWVAGLIFTLAFSSRLNRRYMNTIKEMPLYLAQMAPRARVPATTYVPPPLQANGLGWYPEFNKVWEWFGMPGYSF